VTGEQGHAATPKCLMNLVSLYPFPRRWPAYPNASLPERDQKSHKTTLNVTKLGIQATTGLRRRTHVSATPLLCSQQHAHCPGHQDTPRWRECEQPTTHETHPRTLSTLPTSRSHLDSQQTHTDDEREHHENGVNTHPMATAREQEYAGE